MKELFLDSVTTRINQIKVELIDMCMDKYKSEDEFIPVNTELIIDGKKITHIYYFNGWRKNDLELYSDKDNSEFISINDLSLDNLVLLAEIIL